MSFFSKFSNKKTYATRYPQYASIYNALGPQQQRLLDDFSYRDDHQLSADMKVALTRIAELYVVPNQGAKTPSLLKTEAKRLYQLNKMTLGNGAITTNASASLLGDEKFMDSDGIKTIWNAVTNKTSGYATNRQAVEENAFGLTIDWSVKIKDAANARPIYAGLNFVNHPRGAAPNYGSVVFEYKSDVKARATFISKDTFSGELHFMSGTPEQIEVSRNKICTNAALERLMCSVSDNQLRALCAFSESRYQFSQHPPNYIEAQIHGGIDFGKDLQEIRIPDAGLHFFEDECKAHGRTPGAMLYLAQEFASKHNVPIYRVDMQGNKTPL